MAANNVHISPPSSHLFYGAPPLPYSTTSIWLGVTRPLHVALRHFYMAFTNGAMGPAQITAVINSNVLSHQEIRVTDRLTDILTGVTVLGSDVTLYLYRSYSLCKDTVWRQSLARSLQYKDLTLVYKSYKTRVFYRCFVCISKHERENWV